jgi:hypothetical protein
MLKNCLNCGDKIEVEDWQIKHGKGKFCSRSCNSIFQNEKREKLKQKEAESKIIEWNEEIAYLLGLVVSDGHIGSDRSTVCFTNKDNELINIFISIVESITGKRNNLTTTDAGCKQYKVTDRSLYNWLKERGVTPNKSLSIGKIEVPNSYFLDFLKGVIDGDGSVCYKNRVNIRIYSGSKDFLEFIREQLIQIFDNSFNKNIGFYSGCYRLVLAKSDVKRLINKMDFNRYCYKNKWDGLLKNKSKLKNKKKNNQLRNSKFNRSEVNDIKNEYNETELSMRDLSEKYCCSATTIHNIINEKTYN